MRVYVVLSENGTIIAVYRNKTNAVVAVENLKRFYEEATIKECKVL